MNALTHKAVADVTRRAGRTLLMVLGILLGVMGITAVNQANSQIGGTFLYNTNPTAIPTITMIADTSTLPVSTLATIGHLPAIEKLQVRGLYSAHWQFEGRNADHTMQFFAYPDANTIQLSPFQVVSGRLPSAGEVVLDTRNLQEGYPAALGDTIAVAAPDSHLVSLRVVGLSRTQGWAAPGGSPGANPFGYLSPAGLAQLATGSGNNSVRQEILVRTPDAAALQTYQAMIQILQHDQVRVDPKSSWRVTAGGADTQLGITGPLMVIQFLALLSLVLVCAMIFNAVTTLLAEQIQIIGTMKALGGTRLRIMGSYLFTVAIYSVVGTALGLGLGLVGGYQLASLLSSTVQLNVGGAALALDAGPFQLSPSVLIISVLVGLLVPQLAALWPLWAGTSITVREAMAAYGVRTGQGRASKRAWGREVQWMPQLVWLGLRGLFRRPGRTTFTLVALTLSGAIFFAVQMGNASLGLATTTEASPILNPDVRIDIGASTAPVLTALRSLPNVQSAVPVTFADAILEQNRLFLTGVPADQYQPHVVAGRWLHPHEEGSIVLNEVAVQKLHLRVGDQIGLTLLVGIGSQSSETAQVRWTIVGLIHASDYVDGSADAQGTLGEAFITPETLNGAIHRTGDFADRIIVHAHDHSPPALQLLQTQITTLLTQRGQINIQVRTIQQLDQGFIDPLPVTYSLFYAVAIVVGFVGLLSLALTLATSVLEHRLEIGVLRSVGATGWQVGLVFCVEGLALAGLACVFSSAFGLLGGVILVRVLATFLGLLDITISPSLILSTVLFIIIVAIVASVGPALVASRMSIRSILQYE
ncbi:MAG TPA: FtsX-like permease family protein [Ktedonobacteraceae bacterium]